MLEVQFFVMVILLQIWLIVLSPIIWLNVALVYIVLPALLLLLLMLFFGEGGCHKYILVKTIDLMQFLSLILMFRKGNLES